MERALITQYEADIAQLLRDLIAEKLPLAVQIASVPEGIRGYGHVKAQHHAQAEMKRQRLWADWQGK
jgi:indolepyruvate ferredoxin oxidoreductase